MCVEAHQEMTEAANKKADKLEAEIAKMKRTLSELFSQQILDQMFPRVACYICLKTSPVCWVYEGF